MAFDPFIFASLASLFGIAANFRAMDGYSFLRSLLSSLETKLGVLFSVVLVTALLSPVVLNDVVILILTPVLVKYSKQFKVDIAPMLVAEVAFTNIASTLTPFGNPQNLLLWQASGISAAGFVAGTWLPLLVSGALTAAALFLVGRGGDSRGFPTPIVGRLPMLYLAAVCLTVFVSDALGAPTVLSLLVAFAIGLPFTVRTPKALAREFDYRSMLLLFALVGSIAVLGAVLQPLLSSYVASAVSGGPFYSAAFMGLASNVISNVPATQLVLATTNVAPAAAPRIAVEAGLAGNITPIGSFANILALTIVRRGGLPVRRAVLLQLGVGLVSFLPALF